MTDAEILATHSWQWDEGSSGAMYEFCLRCLSYREDCERNEFHGPVPCIPTPREHKR